MASDEILAKVEQWLIWDRNEKTRQEVKDLVAANKCEELEKRFSSRIEFGTAGLRGLMAAGISTMNDVVVIQTSQGLSGYVLEVIPSSKKSGVVIGYDGRHNSERWALLAAQAFLKHEIPVHLFPVVVPTPFVGYAVKYLKAACGVMVTASHNPKEDNGYKVFWDNAAQIVSPHDKNISQSILQHLEMDDASWDVSSVTKHPLRRDPLHTVQEAYFLELHKYVNYKEQNGSTDLKMVYTAMHGVGWNYVRMAVDTFGFRPCIPVEEQVYPDPDFSTVTFPNPEEGRSALDLAIKTAESHSATLILANDPDADRLAVAEKNLSTGLWKVLTGNEVGTLLGWWLWSNYKAKNPGASGGDVYMMASTVSSKFLQTLAEAEGFNFIETLTGFKWMGNKAIELESQGKTVLFSFEEAIGFLVGTLSYDKDGVSALGVVYEMAAYLKRQDLQLHDQLDILYQKYGHHVSNNSYYICHDQQKIKNIFNRIRNYDGAPNTYPKEINGVKVNYVRDLTTGYDNQQPDNRAILPTSSSSQMITFTFANNTVFTLRTSGTEPKVKYYSEIRQKGISKEELEDILNDLVKSALDEMLLPERNQLIARAS